MGASISSKSMANRLPANQPEQKAVVRVRRKKRKSNIQLYVIGGLLAVILASGVFFGFSSSSSSLKTTASLSPEDRKLFKDVSIYLEDYREIYESYPSSMQDLIDLEWYTEPPRDQYLNPITYQLHSDGISYTLRSVGKDRLIKTPDDACWRSVTKNNVSLHFFTCNL